MTFHPTFRLNLISSWAAHLVTMLVGAFLMPFILHTVGEQRYGTWLFISAVASFSQLLRIGMGATISRYIATYSVRNDLRKINQIINIVLLFYLVMGLISFLIAVLFAWLAPFLHDWDGVSIMEVRLVIIVLGINIAVGFAGSVFGGVLMGAQRFDIERATAISTGLLKVLLVTLFLGENWSLLVLAFVFLAMTIVENAGHAYFAFRVIPNIRLGIKYLNRDTFNEVWSFSGYAFLDDVAHHLIYLTDTVVIGMMTASNSQIVPYYIALRICQFINKPVQQLAMVAMPKAGELHENSQGWELQKLVTRAMEWTFLLIAGVFIGALFFGQTLIDAWVGEGFEESYLLLIILLASQLVANPLSLLRSVLFGTGNVRIPALLYFGEAVLNLLLSLVLVQIWGLPGVALGTLMPIVIFEMGVLLPYAMRILKLNPRKLFYNVVLVNLFPLTILMLYSAYVNACNPWHTGGISYIRIGDWSLLEGMPAQHVRDWLGLFIISAGGGSVLVLSKLVMLKIEKLFRQKNVIGLEMANSRESGSL